MNERSRVSELLLSHFEAEKEKKRSLLESRERSR